MTPAFNENSYEQALIALFTEELGYEYSYGYDVERSLREPYHHALLEAAIKRLNPSQSAEAQKEALRKVCNISEGSLIQNNERFTLWLQNGVEVVTKAADGTERTVLMQLVDFEDVCNNDFRIVNQWRVEEFQQKRCDLVVMVNGLPLVVVELKSAVADDTDIHDAYLQIRNYQQAVPSLFTYNAFNVISDMTETRAGTISANESRYMEWKTVDGQTETATVCDYRTFFLGMFGKERLLNILRNFICFDKREGQSVKILTAYHQFYAVNKALLRTYEAINGDGRIGVFWHTQGSGKSLSMVFLAHLLIREFPGVTLVVVTDRKDLDNQLFTQFSRCKEFLRETPVNAGSRDELGRLLKDRESGGVVFTTIQKFEEGDSALSQRRNIIVMTDEAHRSQYGEEYWDTQRGMMRKGFSKKMREALPGASFIGFTGTPISDRDRDTEEVFGNYIDIYDMSQAVDDGATRPVYYESRVINLHLSDADLKKLDAEFDRLADEGANDEQIRQAKHDKSGIEQLLGDDETINSLVTDIINHYEQNRQYELTGKAMIVAYSRSIAIKIYKRMLQLRPEWTDKVKVVMSSSNKDPEEWQEIIGNEVYKQELARNFKNDDGDMKIAIVRDMWLTGFDVPSLATMYVYKPMKGHNLMQAIARVNRVFPEKEGGLIVDYVGIAQALKNAMQQYSNRDRKRFGDTNIANTALLKWQEEMEICRNQLFGYNYTNFFLDSNKKKAEAITGGVNFLSIPQKDEQKKNFLEHSRLLHNATTLCRSLLSEHQRAEVCYMDALRIMLSRLGQKGKISKHEINERIAQLLQQSIKCDGVLNLFAGNDREFSLFDENFLAEIKKMKEKNLAVELLTKLLKDRIRKSQRTNLVQSELFSDMLSQSLSTYLKGMLTNEEVIEELLEIARKIKADEEQGNDLGLSVEEKAFYDALAMPEGIREAYNDEEFVALTKELTETLHRNRTIDWNHKESARAKMRVMVKRLLKKYKYPPEGQEQALETVMRQCDQWAGDEDNFTTDAENFNEISFSHSSPIEYYQAAEEED